MDKQSQPENVPECAESNQSPTPEDRATAFELASVPPALAVSRDMYHVHRSFTTRDLGGRLLFEAPDSTETPNSEFGNSDPGCSMWSASPLVCSSGNEEHGSNFAIITGDLNLGFTCIHVPVIVENPQYVQEIRQKSVYTPDARARASSDSREGGAREPPESVEEAVDVAYLPESSQPREPDETPVELVSSAHVPSNLGHSNVAPSASMSVVSRAEPEGNSGKKLFVCSRCWKFYPVKKRLLEQWRTHTGQRPFSCNICGKRCTTKRT